ncbi:hypothetical protein SCD_n00567 [Sulfuricella denitrificans skB26]|uniref:Uncharacterized protein n=1 Tax=Sulfuricella denitrificans (strain DSM 22764 / NBRC 105220 / skB26) TaxID=1163617 RepID=S6AIP4_SULDS|nr:hypothetical protein [Sulfuricella denitrificans]BAN34414.1 hypothetical protein SCD_n00567 [Sulfuricella denitrificans skB26]
MARLIFILMITSLSGHAVCAGTEPPREDPGQQQAEASIESNKIGRLFFSPDERAMLDRLRQKSGGSSTLSTTEQITLNGIVQRSSGKNTAWLNQFPQHGNETPQGITVLKSNGRSSVVPLQLPSGKQVSLKPGQTFDITKGKVHEGYEDNTVPAPHEAAK